MKRWKLSPNPEKLNDLVWEKLAVPAQGRIKELISIIVCAENENRARELVSNKFPIIPDIVNDTRNEDETPIIVLIDSPIMSNEFFECSLIQEDSSISERILQTKYKPRSGYKDE